MLPTITSLPVPVSGKITKICHISDIHIRAGTDNNDPKLTRFEEYVGVVDKISKWLMGLDADHRAGLVIVITGDIVHDNRKAGAPCIELFYEILCRLAKIAPVYIIRGNHDYNQASVLPQDMLTSLMHGLKAFDNVAYLKDTGLYRAGNVGFGLVAIQDALKAGDTHGRVEELPAFPSSEVFNTANGFDKKVALFHGDVPGVYPLEWIGTDKWDWVLLGDLHRMHVVKGGVPLSDKIAMSPVGNGVYKMNTYSRAVEGHAIVAYPGSTIQQNFGETLSGHGFLMWDLESDMVESYHVGNDYGFVNSHLCEGDGRNSLWQVNLSYPSDLENKDCWMDVDKALKLEWFPKIWRLRIKQKKGVNVSLVDIHDMFESKGVVLENVRTYWDDGKRAIGVLGRGGDGDVVDDATTLDLKTFNDPQAWCDYIGTQLTANNDVNIVEGWDKFIKNPESLNIMIEDGIDVLKAEVGDRNAKIGKALEEYKKACEISGTAIHGHTRFELSYMDWSWVLCYGEKCWVNFKDLKGKVNCVSGKNGYGKTSFLETICLALYGEGFPSRSPKSYSASVICMQKPAKSRAYTSIVFEIDNVAYKIKRTYDVQSKDKDKLNAKDITLERCVNGSSGDGNPNWELVHSGVVATRDWVKKNLGDVETFLTSVMITQGFDQDFFDMTAVKQKEYLDRQLRLDSSTAFLGVLKAASLAYEDLSKKLWGLIEVKKGELKGLTGYDGGVVGEDDSEGVGADLGRLDQTIKDKEVVLAVLRDGWSVVNEKVLQKGKAGLEKELDEIVALRSKYRVGENEGEVDINGMMEMKGALKRSVEDVLKRIAHRPELLEDDVDLEGSLEALLGEEEAVRPKCDKAAGMGMTLEGARKKLVDVQRKLKEAGECAKICADLRLKRETFEGEMQLKKAEVDELQKELNVMGTRMSEMAKETVAYTEADYKKWLGEVAEFNGWFSNLDELKEERDEIEKQIAALNDVLVERKTKLSMMGGGVGNVVNSGRYDKVDEAVLVAIYGKWKELHAGLEATMGLYADKKNRLALESEHGYNESCECCMARFVDKARVEAEVDALEKEIEGLKTLIASEFGEAVVECDKDYEEACGILWRLWKGKVVEGEKKLPWLRRDLGLLVKKIEAEAARAERYTRLEAQRDGQMKAVEVRREREAFMSRYQGVVSALDKGKKELAGLEKKVKEIEDKLKELEEQQGMIEGWTKEKADLEGAVAVLEEWMAWEEWNSDKVDMETAIEWVRLKEELKRCDEDIERGRKRMEMADKEAGVRMALGVVDRYEEWVVGMRELDGLRAERAELGVKVRMREEFLEKGRKVAREIEEMTGVWERWRGIGDTLKVIWGVFERFKDWVLEERILPVIVGSTNELLDVMCANHRPIMIENALNAQDKVFSWWLKDGVNRVPLEKASGFQRFVVSLAMRIVLGRMGVAGIKNRQLFIDEGFTSCDADNLTNVPNVLRELLGVYDAIVLVSHLDTLKEGIDSYITIERDDQRGVSQLGYGMTVESLITVKKVGRPKKHYLT